MLFCTGLLYTIGGGLGLLGTGLVIDALLQVHGASLLCFSYIAAILAASARSYSCLNFSKLLARLY